MDPTLTRDAVAHSWRQLVELLGQAAPADLDRQTRCEGWLVRDLVDHVRWGVSMEAEALRSAMAGSVVPATGQQPDPVPDGALAATTADLVRRLLDDLDALLDDVDDRGDLAERMVPLAAGTFPLPFVLGVLAMEAGVHGDDLRHALTGRTDLDQATIRASVDFLAGYLPLAAAAASDRPDGPFVVVLRGDDVHVAFRYDGASWTAAPPEPVPPGATVVTGSDDVLALLLLGRTTAQDPGLSTEDGVAVPPLERWLPGP